MDVPEKFRSTILDISEVSNAVGEKVHPVVLPQGVAYPAILYKRVTNTPHYIQSGNSDDKLIIQVSFLGADYDQAKTVMKAIRTELERSDFTTDENVKVLDIQYEGLSAEDFFDDARIWHIAENYQLNINI